MSATRKRAQAALNPRSRVVERISARAGDLRPHPQNPRRHPAHQRAALAASLEELGFYRPILVRRAEGILQILDGHLRVEELDPEAIVPVDVCDFDDVESRKVLLTTDPLAALAELSLRTQAELREQVGTHKEALASLWDVTARAAQAVKAALEAARRRPPQECGAPAETEKTWQVLVELPSEAAQAALIEELLARGFPVKAL